MRTQFLAELETLRKKNLDEATEQGRGILMALPPDEAARKLMQISLEEDLVLLKGISEKKIADILQEMVDPESAERGQEIFHKLSTGGLVDKLVKETKAQLEPAAGSTPSGN
jgi:flagellar motility protein MotE (MotC chaperone)